MIMSSISPCYYTASRFHRMPKVRQFTTFTNKTMHIHRHFSLSESLNTHVQKSVCVCVGVCLSGCVYGWVFAWGFFSPVCPTLQIQHKVFVFFHPVWFALIQIPIGRLILFCCSGWDSNFSKAWQARRKDGKKPLALLPACHWCMPLVTMCHNLQPAQAGFVKKRTQTTQRKLGPILKMAVER